MAGVRPSRIDTYEHNFPRGFKGALRPQRPDRIATAQPGRYVFCPITPSPKRCGQGQRQAAARARRDLAGRETCNDCMLTCDPDRPILPPALNYGGSSPIWADNLQGQQYDAVLKTYRCRSPPRLHRRALARPCFRFLKFVA